MNNVVSLPTKPEANESQTGGEPKYSAREKALIEDYQIALEAGRYFKFYNASSQHLRLISAECHDEPLPMSFLMDDFVSFCRENTKVPPSPLPSPAYLAYKLETVTGTKFEPNGPPLVRLKRSRHKYVNTFRAFEPEHSALPMSPHFLQLLEAMFPADDERHTFTQYVAHMFQRPEERPSWHPMLLSATGTGKGFLFESILTPLLCGQTRLVKRYSELTGRFSGVMKGTILVQLDDCKSKREDQQTQLKSLMSEERVLLEEKGLAAGMVKTYTRFFLASNEDVPLDLDDTDRRWWIPRRMEYTHGLTGDDGRKERKQNVIQPLADYLKRNGALEAIHHYFMTYPLEGFDPKTPPMTETLRDQIAKSVTVEQTFAAEFLADHPTRVLKSQELSAAFSEARMTKPSNQAIGKLLKDADYHQDYLTVCGSKSRWWFPVSMSRDQAEAILEAQPAF